SGCGRKRTSEVRLRPRVRYGLVVDRVNPRSRPRRRRCLRWLAPRACRPPRRSRSRSSTMCVTCTHHCFTGRPSWRAPSGGKRGRHIRRVSKDSNPRPPCADRHEALLWPTAWVNDCPEPTTPTSSGGPSPPERPLLGQTTAPHEGDPHGSPVFVL